MKQLMLNDGRSMVVQSVTASGGVMHIRTILATSEDLKAFFADEFASSLMTLYENGREKEKYENYTILTYIKEETGGIWEVEMRQSAADTDARLEELEDMTGRQSEEIEQIRKEIAERGAGVDQELFAASIVVARANAQDLPDAQALEAKALYPAWNPSGIEYAVDYKVLHDDILYKCISAHTSQESWAPGAAPSLWTAIESGKHAGTEDDPIPVPETVTTAGMEYEYGKYYQEGDAVYLCQQSGVEKPEEMYGQKITLYFPPSALIGQYFSVAE